MAQQPSSLHIRQRTARAALAVMLVAWLPWLVACGGGALPAKGGSTNVSAAKPADPPSAQDQPPQESQSPPAPVPSKPAASSAASDDTAEVSGTPPSDPVELPLCSQLPPIPVLPEAVLRKLVTDFGAVPDDEGDDTAAIEQALKSLQPGEWLVFPPGRYLHSRSLQVRTPDVVLWGEGATLHATEPKDMAVLVRRDKVRIYHFTLTGDADVRRSAPEQARIAIYPDNKDGPLLTGIVIRGNHIVPGTGPQQANGASSGGIFVYKATEFLVAENTVERTLADGIHITGGSTKGRVLANRVRDSGDDMIAVVSYLGRGGWSGETGAEEAAAFHQRKERSLVRDILIEGNDVAGQYWGRGITVVGGENVTIRRNDIADTTYSAGILLAREHAYATFGVRNVLVQDNTIRRVQTTQPPYRPANFCQGKSLPCPLPPTKHGAVEVHSLVFLDELAEPLLSEELSVRNVRLEGNIVEETLASGIRMGVHTGRTGTLKRYDDAGELAYSREFTGGLIAGVSVVNNRFSDLGTRALGILNEPTPAAPLYCSGNLLDSAPVTAEQCVGSAWPVEGARLDSCR